MLQQQQMTVSPQISGQPGESFFGPPGQQAGFYYGSWIPTNSTGQYIPVITGEGMHGADYFNSMNSVHAGSAFGALTAAQNSIPQHFAPEQSLNGRRSPGSMSAQPQNVGEQDLNGARSSRSVSVSPLSAYDQNPNGISSADTTPPTPHYHSNPSSQEHSQPCSNAESPTASQGHYPLLPILPDHRAFDNLNLQPGQIDGTLNPNFQSFYSFHGQTDGSDDDRPSEYSPTSSTTLIAPPDRMTQQSGQPGFARAENSPIDPQLHWQGPRQPLSQMIPQQSASGPSTSPAPPTDTNIMPDGTANPYMRCTCGSTCQCLYCLSHPNNTATQRHAHEIQQILHRDHSSYENAFASDQNISAMAMQRYYQQGEANTLAMPNGLASQPNQNQVPQSTLNNGLMPNGLDGNSSGYFHQPMAMPYYQTLQYNMNTDCTNVLGTCMCMRHCSCQGCRTHDGHNAVFA